MLTRLKDKIRLRKRLKQQGKTNFFESMNHALDGISYTATHERNFRIETCIAFIVSILGVILHISLIEWTILVLVIAMVLSLEIVNTAIERNVDLVTKEYRELARIAKDASAGAVLVMSMFSLIIGILIFLPKIIEIIGG